MTVNELRDLLEDTVENGYGKREVLSVYQQNYPLQKHFAGRRVPVHVAHMDDKPEDKADESP